LSSRLGKLTVWKSIRYFNNIVYQVKAEIGFGEEVRLIGNVPALGCDDVARSIPLICSPATYPWWTTKEGKTTVILTFSVRFYYVLS
jgi:hypothetical protein